MVATCIYTPLSKRNTALPVVRRETSKASTDDVLAFHLALLLAKLELLTKSIYYAKAGKHNGGIDEAAMLQKRK